MCTVASAHSWMSQSPAARAALLWALAAALQRREPNLVSRLERHGVELRVAKAEVELSMKRLRAWGARVQAQGCALQVRGVRKRVATGDTVEVEVPGHFRGQNTNNCS